MGLEGKASICDRRETSTITGGAPMKPFVKFPALMKVIPLISLVLASAGCSTVGPSAIRNGRGVYASSLSRTDDEQLLTGIVAFRYAETHTQLLVTSITSNIRVSTNAGVDIGFGPDENYAGNLVPFTGGVVYEENPTITYSPLQGSDYLDVLLSPISLETTVRFLRATESPGGTLTVLVREINGVRNPDFIYEGSTEPGDRFSRLAEILDQLHRRDEIDFALDEKGEKLVMVLRPVESSPGEDFREFLSLLGAPAWKDDEEFRGLPIRLSLTPPRPNEIAISTRSSHDLFEIMSAAVQIPDEHVEAGIVDEFPPLGPVGSRIAVRSTRNRPKNASIAVPYRGYWFYIDESDLGSKKMFRLLRVLWNGSMAGAGAKQAAPVLTVPVSR
jgi:hypothetical protein